MDDNLLDPENYPAKTRILARQPHDAQIQEMEIVEWSPSGDFVKVNNITANSTFWINNPKETGPIVLEVLIKR